MLTFDIEKSAIPIVWLDTSVITNITIYKKSPDKLEHKQRLRIEALYKQVYECSRAGKIIGSFVKKLKRNIRLYPA